MKYDVSCKKLHFFTFEVQGQLSKEKQTISVTSMKLHFITSEVQGQLSKEKQTISVTSMKFPRSITGVVLQFCVKKQRNKALFLENKTHFLKNKALSRKKYGLILYLLFKTYS